MLEITIAIFYFATLLSFVNCKAGHYLLAEVGHDRNITLFITLF